MNQVRKLEDKKMNAEDQSGTIKPDRSFAQRPPTFVFNDQLRAPGRSWKVYPT